MAQPNSDLNLVRLTAKDSGFLTKVFTQGNTGLSSAQLTFELNQALKAIGVKLPTNAQISLDTCQIILAGGAVAKDFAFGASTLQCVGDISIGVAGVSDILSTLHLIDPTVSDFIGLGTNVAIVLASGGANVLADIGAVISLVNCVRDIGPNLFGSEEKAQATAHAAAINALQNQVKNYFNPQTAFAATELASYTQGKQTIFDTIGNIAAGSPVTFPGLFPGIACYFPSWIDVNFTASATATSKGWFSSKTETNNEKAKFVQQIFDKKKVEGLLVEKFISEPLEPFENFQTVAPVISIKALSALALLVNSGTAGDNVINFGTNIIGLMRGLGVTPSILGDDWLFKGLQRNENDIADWACGLPYRPITLNYYSTQNSGLTINGVDFLTTDEQANNKKVDSLIRLQKILQHYDEIGDIESLLKVPEAVAILKRWANIHVKPIYYSLSEYQLDLQVYNGNLDALTAKLNSLGQSSYDKITHDAISKEIAALPKPSVAVNEIVNMKLIGKSITTQTWFDPKMDTDPATPTGKKFWNFVTKNYGIDMSDYWKCLSTLKLMERSDLFDDEKNFLEQKGSIDVIETQFNKTYNFFIAKQTNILARRQLAENLGIPENQLASRHDSNGNLIFYQKAV